MRRLRGNDSFSLLLQIAIFLFIVSLIPVLIRGFVNFLSYLFPLALIGLARYWSKKGKTRLSYAITVLALFLITIKLIA